MVGVALAAVIRFESGNAPHILQMPLILNELVRLLSALLIGPSREYSAGVSNIEILLGIYAKFKARLLPALLPPANTLLVSMPYKLALVIKNLMAALASCKARYPA